MLTRAASIRQESSSRSWEEGVSKDQNGKYGATMHSKGGQNDDAQKIRNWVLSDGCFVSADV